MKTPKYCFAVEMFDIRENIIEFEATHRGGNLKVDVSSLFPTLDTEDAIMGAYQNYLGGGMLGSVIGAAMFDPSTLPNKNDLTIFEDVKDKIKRYLHEETRHDGDEWEDADYEEGQRRPASFFAY